MNGYEIRNIVQSDKVLQRIFLGIFPSDKLPWKIPFRPAALIANIDRHYQSGQHWVAFYFDSSGNVDYFDSLGLPPFVESFNRFMRRNSKMQNFNKIRYQSSYSATCGLYCIFFLFHRCRDIAMNSIFKYFTPNLMHNDSIICNFMQNVYSVCPSSCCFRPDLQLCIPYWKMKFI